MKPGTPLPWPKPARGNGYADIANAIADVVDYYRLDIEDGELSAEELARIKQDAAYIVHAANNYPKLVEALRGLLGGLDHGQIGTGDVAWCPANSDLLTAARAALHEAGETEGGRS